MSVYTTHVAAHNLCITRANSHNISYVKLSVNNVLIGAVRKCIYKTMQRYVVSAIYYLLDSDILITSRRCDLTYSVYTTRAALSRERSVMMYIQLCQNYSLDRCIYVTLIY